MTKEWNVNGREDSTIAKRRAKSLKFFLCIYIIMAFRSQINVERYEDVVFELETPLIVVVANNAHQKKKGYRFIANNNGEIAPFDWYAARFVIDFKVVKVADGSNITVNDHNGIVNRIHSLIKGLTVKANDIQVYDCRQVNHAVNIKNLLEYSPSYAEKTASNELFYLDTSNKPEEHHDQVNYNKGFAMRKGILGASATVNVEIPLNRYSFFEALRDQLLPNMKIELSIDLESDGNVIWQAADECRVVIAKFQLWVPKIIFNSMGTGIYTSQFLKPHKWTYEQEMVERSNSTKQRVGTFKITSGIDRPRHVFIWFLNDDVDNLQTKNSFIYNTFSVVNNRALVSCHLEVGNGVNYPENEYSPPINIERVFRDVLSYTYSISDYPSSTLLTRENFQELFPLIYFDLRFQREDL